MEEIQYTPIGRTCLTPKQKAERCIRRLKRYVAALGVTCIGMAAVICMMLMR